MYFLRQQTKDLPMKNKFTPYKQYLFGLFLSRNKTKNYLDRVILQVLLLCLPHKNFQK